MLILRDLKKYFVSGAIKKRVTKAVDGINLSVTKGRIYGLTGESGCGKSTLAMLILRLIDPTSGAVIIEGKDVTRLKPSIVRKLRPDYQIIWQNSDAALNPRMKIKDSIVEPLRYYKKCSRKHEKELLDQYCRMVELPRSLLNRYPHEVSRGENQRAVMARILTLQPKLLIADEPTSSLDVLVQAQLLQLLKKIQKQLNFTLIFISNDLGAIRFMCDQVAVMKNGQIVERGPCRQVFSSPRTPYCQELVDSAFTPWRAAS